ncbi:MAG: FAD-dependent oxidoreductase [Planctomycetia bacterium]|nr:FAD-dependent oxidoreductase [Planctomycetia bacterium]
MFRWIFAIWILMAATLRADEVTCEIVVTGGGSAGIAAALFAGESGAKTILLEATQQLGGNTTSGGVAYPGLFHAWGRQVIAGPAWKLLEETMALGDGAMPDFSKPTGREHFRHQLRISPEVFLLLAEESLQKKGVEIRYYEAPSKLEKTDSGWKVTTSAMGEMRTIHCRVLIDCTGNGALSAMAGAKRMRENETQPGTFSYMLRSGIEMASLSSEQKKEIENRYQAALRCGAVQPGDVRDLWSYLSGSSAMNYVYGADNSTAEKRTETNLRGRAAALRMLRFTRSLPGGEKAKITRMSPEVGVRETWRVVGDYVLTHEDYVSGKVWEDSLCFAFYPVDLHVNATGVRPAHLREGVVPTVPLRALLPAGVEDILVAGRCLSSDRLANSGLRVQGACMATGQAAAAAAVVSVRTRTTPRKVDLSAVKALLREHGGIVP